MTTETRETCALCGTVEETAEAVAAGWVTYFWRSDETTAGPVCPRCTRRHLAYDPEDGEWEEAIPRQD